MSQRDPRPWYPRYPRDFWTAVEVLRLLERHGADGALLYQYALDSAWECGLPNDPAAIYALLPRPWSIARARFDEVWADVRPLLVETHEGRYLSHPRLEEERALADRRRPLTPEQVEQRRAAGLRSAALRRERAGTAQPAKADAPNGASNGGQRPRTEARTEPVREFSNGSVREPPNGASNGGPNGAERSRTDSNGDPHRTVTGTGLLQSPPPSAAGGPQPAAQTQAKTPRPTKHGHPDVQALADLHRERWPSEKPPGGEIASHVLPVVKRDGLAVVLPLYRDWLAGVEARFAAPKKFCGWYDERRGAARPAARGARNGHAAAPAPSQCASPDRLPPERTDEFMRTLYTKPEARS